MIGFKPPTILPYKNPQDQNTLGFAGNNYLDCYTISLKSIRPSKTEIKITAEKNWYISPPGLEPSAITIL